MRPPCGPRITAAFVVGFLSAFLSVSSESAAAQDTTVITVDNAPLWGTSDGPDEYVIGQPASITVDKQGNIFVFDRRTPIIRQYDSRGANLARDFLR